MGLGKLIAKTLRGAWRQRPPILDVTADELALVAPSLIARGEGALGWWRIRGSVLETSPEGLNLRRMYLLQTIQAELYRSVAVKVASWLRAEGVEALFGKGLVASEAYPEIGLRPSGDIDLYIRPDQYARAVAKLDTLNGLVSGTGLFSVDLHCGVHELDDRSFDGVYGRSQGFGDTELRVFSPEDHLRLLCLHALRHGMCRPLWLCDIAAALESRPAGFDWDHFLSGDKRRSQWVVGALGVAHRLIDARIADTPLAGGFSSFPNWLSSAVIKQWERPTTPHGRRAPMILHLQRRRGLIDALLQRWPNPIEATVALRRPVNTRIRFPFQIESSLVRIRQFARQLLAEAGLH